jgi:hypothetical protein
MNDYIIIGCGISALYAAYNIKKKDPNAKITIFEKERIGGRIGLINFCGVPVSIGAGICRKNDKLLISLCKELHIPIKEIKLNTFSTFKIIDILAELKYLRVQFKKMFLKKKPDKNPTFHQFAKQVLKNKYNLFVQSSGFSDYENEDIKRTLYNYNMEDNVRKGIAYLVNWNVLLDKLVQFIKVHIKIEEVKSFENAGDKIIVKTSNAVYNTHKLIIATTVTTLHKLISGYEYICGQPFLKVFAKFNPSDILIDRMNGVNDTDCILTDGPLQKIFAINIEKNIYMISYSDNKHAIKLKPYIKNTHKNRKYFEKLFNECIFKGNKSDQLPTIKEMWGKYWDIGTHYFAPTTKKVNQMPYDNIFIIGEMVADDQGWIEGALDSVEKIKKYL